jgi:hypothetical protein
MSRPVRRSDGVSKDFLRDRSVALILKYLPTQVGFDPSRYAGQLLRLEFLTSAPQNRASIVKMADQSSHSP